MSLLCFGAMYWDILHPPFHGSTLFSQHLWVCMEWENIAHMHIRMKQRRQANAHLYCNRKERRRCLQTEKERQMNCQSGRLTLDNIRIFYGKLILHIITFLFFILLYCYNVSIFSFENPYLTFNVAFVDDFSHSM